MSSTPFDRIWNRHVISEYGEGRAFDGLRSRGLPDDRRRSLLEGLDQPGFMSRGLPESDAFEVQDARHRPWAYHT